MATPAYSRQIVAWGLAVLFAESHAHSANLLQNQNFDTALAPFWALQLSSAPDPAGAGTVSRNGGQDVANSAASGSAEVDLATTQTNHNDAVSVVQCAAVPGGPVTVTQANYGARVKIPATGNPSDGSVNAQVEIRFYSDAACATFIAGAGGSQGRNLVTGIGDDAFWYTAGDANFVPPSGTVAGSVQVSATLRRVTDASAPSLAYFDGLYVSLNGSPMPVVLQSFDVD